MSVMSELDLQCEEAKGAIAIAIANMGFDEDEAIPAYVMVETALQAAHMLTPIISWEGTVPYLLSWAYENFEVEAPTLH